MALAGCRDLLGPSRVLVGTWSSADATLTATASGATLTIPCIEDRFPPLALDGSLQFRVTGVVISAVGLVTVHPGNPATLSGRMIGDRVVIPYPWAVPGPGADTLKPGDGSLHVCDA
jgi:hypothetical protein